MFRGENPFAYQFKDEIEKNPGIKLIVGSAADWERKKAYQVALEIFKKNPDIRGVFAFNDMMADGVADAVALAKVRKPFIVGFNGSLQGINAIKEGRIDATVNQSPSEMGALTVENALRLMEGEKVPAQVFTETDLISKEKVK